MRTDTGGPAAGKEGGAAARLTALLRAWTGEPAGRAALLLCAAAALVVVPVVAGAGPVLRLDRAVAEQLHTLALDHPGWTRAARIVTDWVVDPWAMRLLLAATVLWLWRRGHRSLARWTAAALLADHLLRAALRWGIGRDRPVWEHPVATADFPSMPSGHAMTATTTCLLLLWLAGSLGLRTGLRRAGVVLAVLVVGAAAGTRVLVGVHWPTDTLAGVLLGGAVVAATVAARRVHGAAPGG